jgi:hypothetical protein
MDINSAKVQHNTITNTDIHGIRIFNMAAGDISHNVISNCGASGARIANSSIMFHDNTIFNAETGLRILDDLGSQFDSNTIYNSTYDGINVWNSSPTIMFNLIYNNDDEGIDCSESSPLIVNNTIDNNGLNPSPEGYPSSGIECGENSNPDIINNIITNNADHGIHCFGGSTPTNSYNDIWGHTVSNYQGCSPGTGDISDNPLYMNQPSADYTLQSISPCIDTGDPLRQDPDGTRSDMGAFYFDHGGHFIFTPTEDYYPIIIEAVTLDGIPIVDGDEVGVFFRDDNNDLVCGGAIVWPNTGMEAWGDDSQTPEKDGFVAGEDLFFRLWDVSGQAEWGPPFNVNYVMGDGTWGNGPYAQISLMEFRVFCSITLDLVEGWNWMSINVDPFEPPVADIWAGINCLEILKSYDGFYVPSVWDGIGDWDYKQMYTAYLACPEILYIEGQCVHPSEPIALVEGWNWVSYLPDHPIPIETALATIMDYINIVKAYDGFFIPNVWDGIGDMEPGKGYKINTNQECTLIYPADGALAISSGSEKSAKVTGDISNHFAEFKTTEDYQALLIQSIEGNGIDIVAGNELGLFTESGICIGGVVLTEIYPMGMMAWMDDSRTEDLDGFKIGEKMMMKYWDAGIEKEYDVSIVVEEGSAMLGESVLTKVLLEVDLLSNTESNVIPTSYSLEQNYPNPFNPETTIRYGIPEGNNVRLTVYNIEGKVIKQLDHGYKEAGYHQANWDGTNKNGESVSSGVYIYRMEAGNFSNVKKMIFLK